MTKKSDELFDKAMNFTNPLNKKKSTDKDSHWISILREKPNHENLVLIKTKHEEGTENPYLIGNYIEEEGMYYFVIPAYGFEVLSIEEVDSWCEIPR